MKKIVALIGAGVLAITLTACGSSAIEASVGSDKVTVSDVTTSVNNILTERKKVDTTGMNLPTGDALDLYELNFHLIAYLLADTAAQNGVSITPAEIAARRASIVSQVGSESGMPKALVGANIASADFPMYLKTVLYEEGLAKKVQAQGVATADTQAALQKLASIVSEKLKVKVNPKYGIWDAAHSVVMPPSGSVPAPAPSASK
jgi:hypothetical protein